MCKIERLKSLLKESENYIKLAANEAEIRHDNFDDDCYQDLAQYEIFTKAKDLLDRIEIEFKL